NVTAQRAGHYALTVFYTSAVARAAQMKVNNGNATTINFAGTGDWTTLANTSVNITLNAGSNTLNFSNSTGWSPDIDRIELRKIDGPGATNPAANALVIDGFNENSYLERRNDLSKWVGASGFVNGGGTLSNGALTLTYNNDGWFGSEVSQ